MKKILLVEDDYICVMMLQIMIEDYCKFPLIATNGMDAVRLCKENPDIDFVFMDIKLPNLNGLEATKRIREFNKDVIILAQTAYALPGDREKALIAGCNDYISKPYKQIDLAELLKKWSKKIMVF